MDILQWENPVGRQGILLRQLQQKPGRCVADLHITCIILCFGDMVVPPKTAIGDCKFNHSRLTFIRGYVCVDELLGGFLLPLQPYSPEHSFLF